MMLLIWLPRAAGYLTLGEDGGGSYRSSQPVRRYLAKPQIARIFFVMACSGSDSPRPRNTVLAPAFCNCFQSSLPTAKGDALPICS